MMEDKAYALWLAANKGEEKCCLATIIQLETKEKYRPLRLCMTENGKIETTIDQADIIHALRPILFEKMQAHLGQSEMQEVILKNGNTIQVFVDMFIPKSKIIIFGAGHDAIPVAHFSHALGFETTIVDARETFNTVENFPNCVRIIAHPSSFTEKVPVSSFTYVIIMNHHIEKDRETLQFALQSPSPYVGVLGPRSRREKMLAQLKEDGVMFSSEILQKMYNPIGLDIGAETPEEIAISILSEIIAVQKGHQGGFLHDQHQIHRHTSTYEKVGKGITYVQGTN